MALAVAVSRLPLSTARRMAPKPRFGWPTVLAMASHCGRRPGQPSVAVCNGGVETAAIGVATDAPEADADETPTPSASKAVATGVLTDALDTDADEPEADAVGVETVATGVLTVALETDTDPDEPDTDTVGVETVATGVLTVALETDTDPDEPDTDTVGVEAVATLGAVHPRSRHRPRRARHRHRRCKRVLILGVLTATLGTETVGVETVTTGVASRELDAVVVAGGADELVARLEPALESTFDTT